ncbi:hypothetical protein D3C76_1337430 [compost metagenome]
MLIPVCGSVGISIALMLNPRSICMVPWNDGDSTATISPGWHTESSASDSAPWQPLVITISFAATVEPPSSNRRAICSRSSCRPSSTS